MLRARFEDPVVTFLQNDREEFTVLPSDVDMGSS
jgi:hypothetical protein